MKYTLYVKQSTSNIIATGKCGQIPLSVVCHTKVIKDMDRELGFTTWYSRAWKLVHINAISTSLTTMVTLRHIVNHLLETNSARTGNSKFKI